MRRTVVGLFSAAVLTGTSSASQAIPGQALAPSGLILGRVVEADTGDGIGGAMVTLGGPPPFAASAGELVRIGLALPPTSPAPVMTTDGGWFVFRNLSAGPYVITAAAAGYVDAAFGQGRPEGPGQVITLRGGEKRGDVIVRTWKLASISGTVVDELGEPVVGVSVRSLRRTWSGGHARFDADQSATTDDRGMYRIAGLAPGFYTVGVMVRHDTVSVPVVMATAGVSARDPDAPESVRLLSNSGGSTSSAAGFHVGDHVLQHTANSSLPRTAPVGGRLESIRSTYFAGADTPGAAAIVPLAPGDDRQGIDLTVRPVPGVTLGGIVRAATGPGAYLGLSLVPATGHEFQSEGVAEAATSVTDGEGRFTFLGVPGGEYLLKVRMFPQPPPQPRAATTVGGVGVGRRGAPPPPPLPPSQPTLWAVTPVSVGSTDITDLEVQLRRGLRATGRVEFAGGPPPSADALQQVGIRLQSAEGRTSSPIPADGRVLPDHTFMTSGYPAGRYIVSIRPGTLPKGWSLLSAYSGGRDVTTDPLTLEDRDVTDIVITLTDRQSELSGTVTGVDAGQAEVVVFPADSSAWREIGAVARRLRDVRADESGRFVAPELPPGEYFVAALPSTMPIEPMNPAFLARVVPAATRVTVPAGGRTDVQLQLLAPERIR